MLVGIQRMHFGILVREATHTVEAVFEINTSLKSLSKRCCWESYIRDMKLGLTGIAGNFKRFKGGAQVSRTGNSETVITCNGVDTDVVGDLPRRVIA